MQQYLDLLKEVLENGNLSDDRTGTGTKSIFGSQMRFDLQKGFPAITTKKLFFKGVVVELLWFLTGSTNIKMLLDNNVHIWDAWANEQGEIGPMYGYQWIKNKQIDKLINDLKNNPKSRRMIVNAWNIEDLPDENISPLDNVNNGKGALAACHSFFQCYVHNSKLSLQIYQRSADLFLGVPFNIASYALLVHMLAEQTNLKAGELIWTGGDCHIYLNHLEQVKLQLSRKPYALPTLKIQNRNSIYDYQLEDFILENYQHYDAIKAPISV